ncbi:hypothetical protein WSS_A33145 [Rhodococcus opacus M213]|uniref:Uncharacterized protein n=1 Tax=Rhodococcus opacus M213 TaxID=1129896 RepID=K8XBM2_RHOOP|nr:hypothetical protein WSS_A33145 [Rhodococcus opacus M213]
MVFGDDEACGGGVVLLTGVASGDGAIGYDGAEPRELFGSGVTADALVVVEDDRFAFSLRNFDGDNLLLNRPSAQAAAA